MITKERLRKAKPENVRRLAKWLRIDGVDSMSDRHVIKYIVYLMKRRERCY